MAMAMEEVLVPCDICGAEINFEQWSEHAEQCRPTPLRRTRSRRKYGINIHEETPDQGIPCEYCEKKPSPDEWVSHSTECANAHKRRIEKLRSGTDDDEDHEEYVPCEYCGTQIGLKDFEAHVRQCGAASGYSTNQMMDNATCDLINSLIPCEYCHELVTVLDLTSHTEKCAEEEKQRIAAITRQLEDDPEYNAIPCQYCNQSFPTKEIEKHQTECRQTLYAVDSQSHTLNGISFQGPHAYPDTWNHSSPNNLSQYILDPQSDEYKFVAEKFHTTLAGNPIVQIERIQNRRWYRQYDAHKDDFIERYSQSTEQWLFHGCKGDSTDAIMKDCFNRSHAVRCAVGQGIYFASEASTSLSYTSPNAQNERHMFMARVLIGKTTVGDQTTRICPRGYDTTGCSGVYVTYHDAQAYGEYLITFR